MLACERHVRHLHDGGPRNGVHRQTDAIDCDGAVRARHGGNIRRHCEIDQSCVPCIHHPRDGGHAVHMTLDDMTAHQVGGAHCAFQIDAAALLPLPDQGAPERCLHRVNGKPAFPNPLDGQTGAVDRDALALLHAFVRRLYAQFHTVVQCNGLHTSNRGYDSGKHSRRSKTSNVSEPSGRRSTGIHRGASASGNAGTPGKAGTAPSPSQTGAWTQYSRSTSPSSSSLVPSAPPRGVGVRWQFNAGVPPTASASKPARSQWTWSRASGPEIHCDRPSASAIRRSMDVASFRATKGRSVWRRVKRNGAFCAAASSAYTPICVSMPARFSTS